MKEQDDPFYDPYGPSEKPVVSVMIPIHKVWEFFKKRKKNKKKPVRRN